MKNILICFALVFYSLFFAEWFLRFLNPQAILPRYIQEGPFGIRENIPNAKYRHWTPEVEVLMEINSQGMRAATDYDIEKPEGVCRVAIFGDSFFMGYEVSYKNSIAGQIELKLLELGYKCQVLNFSVSGFGTAESLIMLKKKALDYSPDYVVLEWHHSDPKDNLRSNLFAVTEGEALVKTGDRFLPGVSLRSKLMDYYLYRWAIEYSHLYSMVREKLSIFLKGILLDVKKITSSSDKDKELAIPALPVEVKKYKYNLLDQLLVNEFVATADQAGIKPILLEVPFQRFDGQILNAYESLEIARIKPEALILSPTSRLNALFAEGVPLYRQKGHSHFNERGYAEVAFIVAKNIADLEGGASHAK